MGGASSVEANVGSFAIMRYDNINEITIDDKGRLRIYPEKERFNGIYRLTKEVSWNNEESFLYSQKPIEWSYLDWYNHICTVLKEDSNCELKITEATIWNNIPVSLKEEILSQ
jgi:hypothetical protein